MINREVRGISVNKIIALDIDEFRVGVVGYGYQDVRSSVYSEVKKNNLQYLLGKNNEPIYLKNKVGKRILLGGSEKEITWGLDKLYSRRSEAYQTFGNPLAILGDQKFKTYIKTILSYLVAKRPSLFTEIAEDYFSCSLCLGVATESFDRLADIERQLADEFETVVDGTHYQIRIERVKLIPKSLGAIFESKRNDIHLMLGVEEILAGLTYVIEINDHSLTCDSYENGELIKSSKVTDGLFELAGNVVQDYQENEGDHPAPIFALDHGVVYDMLVTAKKNNPFVVTINGGQTIDLTEIVKKETTALTDQLIDYVNSDQDIQYADTILIRDIPSETINENTVNQALNKMGLSCKVFNNKNALGVYLFGELFWKSQLNASIDHFEDNSPFPMKPDGLESKVNAEPLPVEKSLESSTNQIDSELPEATKQKSHHRSLSVEAIFAEQSELLDFLISNDKE